MVNYEQGKIYKIVCNVSGKVYIGSTTKHYLSQRLDAHKQGYKRFVNGKHAYMTSFDIIMNGDYNIVLLESFPCQTRDELLSRERFYFDTVECVNKVKPKVSLVETKERVDLYLETNIDKVREYKKNYKLRDVDRTNEQRMRYREKYREELREKAKVYNQQQREVEKTIVNCVCGCKVQRRELNRHLKTKKHMNFDEK